MGGFAHAIADSVDAALLVISGGATAADYGMRFFAPTLIGNINGGVALVAVLNFGQVAHEVDAWTRGAGVHEISSRYANLVFFTATLHATACASGSRTGWLNYDRPA